MDKLLELKAILNPGDSNFHQVIYLYRMQVIKLEVVHHH